MQSLTESELGIMLTLWEATEPVSRMCIQKKLAHLNWKSTTFNTYLTRLQDKGFLTSESRGQTYYYRALVSQEAYREKESKSMLGKLFDGSLKNFVLSVSNTDAVDEKDLDELRVLLDQMKGGYENGK